jgi:hypothetical protein
MAFRIKGKKAMACGGILKTTRVQLLHIPIHSHLNHALRQSSTAFYFCKFASKKVNFSTKIYHLDSFLFRHFALHPQSYSSYHDRMTVISYKFIERDEGLVTAFNFSI